MESIALFTIRRPPITHPRSSRIRGLDHLTTAVILETPPMTARPVAGDNELAGIQAGAGGHAGTYCPLDRDAPNIGLLIYSVHGLKRTSPACTTQLCASSSSSRSSAKAPSVSKRSSTKWAKLRAIISLACNGASAAALRGPRMVTP